MLSRYKKKFRKVYLEITNTCNLHCHFCTETSKPPAFLSLSSFEQILDQLKPFTSHLYFHVKGEPLLHPQIDTLLEVCYEKDFMVNIVTNGTMINVVKDKILSKPSLRQISFSLHCFEDIVKTTFEKNYLQHILSFIKQALEQSSIIISMRLWNLNGDKGKNLKNNPILQSIEEGLNLKIHLEEMLSQTNSIKIYDRLYLNADYQFQWPDINDCFYQPKGFCYALRDQAAILVDGTVVPCCLDYQGTINLGNIFKENFNDIITSHRAVKIFEGFSQLTAVEPLCIHCQYKSKFQSGISK